MKKLYKSFAQWPEGTLSYQEDQITDDTHGSKEEAESVCDRLRRNGFGGNRQIFPIRVWVEEILDYDPVDFME